MSTSIFYTFAALILYGYRSKFCENDKIDRIKTTLRSFVPEQTTSPGDDGEDSL